MFKEIDFSDTNFNIIMRIVSDTPIVKIDGELLKPLNTLIEKVAEATGILYEPQRIKRKAKAEAEAAVITAKSKIEITEIERRAADRFLREQVQYQQNIENIIEKALPRINEDPLVDNISNDWLLKYFDKCRLVSENEMQELWAKVFANEVNDHGSFSVSTIDILSKLGPREASSFSRLCSLCIQMKPEEGEGFIPHIITHLGDHFHWFKNMGVTFENLIELETLGLIIEKEHSLSFDKNPEKVCFKYFETKWEKLIRGHLPMGNILLTQSGIQLYRIALDRPHEKLLENLPAWVKPEA